MQSQFLFPSAILGITKHPLIFKILLIAQFNWWNDIKKNSEKRHQPIQTIQGIGSNPGITKPSTKAGDEIFLWKRGMGKYKP